MNKCLIGKNNYLFLINDSCNELQIHCNNLNLIKDKSLSHIKFKNYMIIIFPDKSLYYKKYLPDEYIVKYRPGVDLYKTILGNKVFDAYEFMKDTNDLYYKTDTHINLKGNYLVYLEFINKCNSDYNMNLKPKVININVKENVKLSSLNIGIGDLTWSMNVGDQILDDTNDNYYYSNDITEFYLRYKIQNTDYLFYNYKLENKTKELENKIVDWNIISSYIIYKNNNLKEKNKVLIFYDSFLINMIPIYIELFNEVYFIKNVYNNELIDLINPDYIFEFKIERFL